MCTLKLPYESAESNLQLLQYVYLIVQSKPSNKVLACQPVIIILCLTDCQSAIPARISTPIHPKRAYLYSRPLPNEPFVKAHDSISMLISTDLQHLPAVQSHVDPQNNLISSLNLIYQLFFSKANNLPTSRLKLVIDQFPFFSQPLCAQA